MLGVWFLYLEWISNSFRKKSIGILLLWTFTAHDGEEGPGKPLRPPDPWSTTSGWTFSFPYQSTFALACAPFRTENGIQHLANWYLSCHLNLHFKMWERPWVFCDVCVVIEVDVVSSCAEWPYGLSIVTSIFLNSDICFSLMRGCYRFQLIWVFYTFSM